MRCDRCQELFITRGRKTKEVRGILSKYGYNELCPKCIKLLKEKNKNGH